MVRIRIRESRIQNRSVEGMSCQRSGKTHIVKRGGKEMGKYADGSVYLDKGVFDVFCFLK